MEKKEKIVGITHSAHEARHVSRKMEEVREGKTSFSEIKKYRKKLINEREVLISRFKDCWAYLGNREKRVLQYENIPTLTKEEARKHIYLKGYDVSDFDYIKRVELAYQYPIPSGPQKEHVGPCSMLLQAAINDLTWAIAELNAYLEE